MESHSDVEANAEVQEIIMKIQLAREKLQKSSFYAKFVKQIENPEMMTRIEKVRSIDPHHSQLQVVLYGVGVIDPHNNENTDVEPQHMQLCLAILMRENFEWVRDIVVYDPVLSTIEQEAINALDCNFLSVNENGRRTVNRPTLFFMPHCDLSLTDNVLQANWTHENLNKIIILGNSLKNYDLDKEFFAYHRLTKKIEVVLDSDHMLHEMPLPHTTISLSGARHCSIGRLYERSFYNLSWHFFDWDGSLHGFQRQDPKMFAFNIVKCNKSMEKVMEKIRLGMRKLRNSSFYKKKSWKT